MLLDGMMRAPPAAAARKSNRIESALKKLLKKLGQAWPVKGDKEHLGPHLESQSWVLEQYDSENSNLGVWLGHTYKFQWSAR